MVEWLELGGIEKFSTDGVLFGLFSCWRISNMFLRNTEIVLLLTTVKISKARIKWACPEEV